MSDKWVTHLDLYTPATSEKPQTIYHRLTGLDAYDGWHSIAYLKEIFNYRALSVSSNFSFNDIPRKEKNVLLYLILRALPEIKNVAELGSSLMEVIDGLEAVNKYYLNSGKSGLKSKISDYHFVGIESSVFLNQIGLSMYPHHKITLFDQYSKMKNFKDTILYDRAVSAYAFKETKELADFLNKFEVAFLNLFLSRGELFVSTTSGGNHTYFSLKELASLLKQPLHHLFGFKTTGVDRSLGKPVIEGFFFYGPQVKAERFMKEAQGDEQIKEYFQQKEIILKDVRTLF